MDTNIAPNQNSETLQGTVKTQPAAVVTSDLATNITNKNLETLAQEERAIKMRLEQERLLKAQRDQEAAKKQSVAPTPVDRAINETLGAPEVAPSPEEILMKEKQDRRKNISTQIANISKQVDPFTAQVLANIENLVLTQDN